MKKFMKKFIRKILKSIKCFYSKNRSNFFLSRNIKKDYSTHVIFICQYEACWKKFKPLFENLIKNNYKSTLFIVNDDNSTKSYYKKKLSNKTTVFEKEYPGYCIKYEKGILKKLNPSIVIYTRPYNHYLPKDIRSTKVIKYSKTGLINYFYPLTDNASLFSGMIPTINCFIASNKFEKDYFDNICSKGVSKGYQKALNYGYPIFENLYDNISDNSNFKNDDRIKIIWAPRWSDSTNEWGGSNFIDYYNDLFNYFINNPKYSLIFRPHPLMFSNFINNGKITNEEKDELINRINCSDNCFYDCNATYLNNFYNADILISDYSSIIPEFFITGKPIIFCQKNNNYNLFNETLKKMVDCNYIVNSFSEIKNILENNDLSLGKKNREEYSREFVNNHIGSTQRIINEIIK